MNNINWRSISDEFIRKYHSFCNEVFCLLALTVSFGTQNYFIPHIISIFTDLT